MEEIWEDIEGYEGLYQVSNLGRVRSLDRKIYQDKDGSTYSRLIKGKVLKYNYDKQGYTLVHLCSDGKRSCKKVHRLVAKSFIKNGYGKEYINHKDGNKKNNSVNNLEWVTPSENNIHAYKIGLSKPTRPMLGRKKEKHPTYGLRGKLNHKSKKVLQYDKNNNFIKEWECLADIERKLKIKESLISLCCRGIKYHKTAGGYIWKYKEE